MSFSKSTARRCAVWLGAVFAVALGSSPEAAVVRFDPGPATVGVGDSFSLNLIGEGFADILDGGGVGFTFDPGIVQVIGITVDAGVWDFSTSAGVIDNVGGSVTDILFNALQNVTGNFNIATLQFQAIGVGLTGLALSEAAINPFASGGNPLAVTLTDGNIQVSGTVSEPAVWLLLGGGLGFAVRFNKHPVRQSS